MKNRNSKQFIPRTIVCSDHNFDISEEFLWQVTNPCENEMGNPKSMMHFQYEFLRFCKHSGKI